MGRQPHTSRQSCVFPTLAVARGMFNAFFEQSLAHTQPLETRGLRDLEGFRIRRLPGRLSESRRFRPGVSCSLLAACRFNQGLHGGLTVLPIPGATAGRSDRGGVREGSGSTFAKGKRQLLAGSGPAWGGGQLHYRGSISVAILAQGPSRQITLTFGGGIAVS